MRYPLAILFAVAGLPAAMAVRAAAMPEPLHARGVGLRVGGDATGRGLAADAQWQTRWGQAAARASAWRSEDGRALGAARAWWRSELPGMGAALRLGHQRTTANLVREAADLTGLGLSGRVAPLRLDYALSVGRFASGLFGVAGVPAHVAWLRRAIDARASIGVHMLLSGAAREVGAVFDAGGAWLVLDRLGLVQRAGPQAPPQTRLVSDHHLALRGLAVQARAEWVVDGCGAWPPAGLAPAGPQGAGCAGLSANGQVELLPSWQLRLGTNYRRDADESSLRQDTVGAAWRPQKGVRLEFSLQRDDGSTGSAHRVGARLSYPLGTPATGGRPARRNARATASVLSRGVWPAGY